MPAAVKSKKMSDPASDGLHTSAGKARKLWYFICLGFLFLFCSCSISGYGRLQSNDEITRLFDDYKILSDHLYYYSGLEGVPDAIIGINSNYSLYSKSWRQVDLSPLLLEKWISRMTYVHLVTPRGAWILGPDGQRIGIWYSARYQATVRMEEGNRVVIIPPLPPELQGGR